MSLPHAVQVDCACYLVIPDFATLSPEAQDERDIEALHWLEAWRSVYPRFEAGPHGIGTIGSETPPIAILRAMKMMDESYLDRSRDEQEAFRKAGLTWLAAWREVLSEASQSGMPAFRAQSRCGTDDGRVTGCLVVQPAREAPFVHIFTDEDPEALWAPTSRAVAAALAQQSAQDLPDWRPTLVTRVAIWIIRHSLKAAAALTGGRF